MKKDATYKTKRRNYLLYDLSVCKSIPFLLKEIGNGGLIDQGETLHGYDGLEEGAARIDRELGERVCVRVCV